jgi:hypothetical protein
MARSTQADRRRADGRLGERKDGSANRQRAASKQTGSVQNDDSANGRAAQRADGAQRAGGQAASGSTARRAEGCLDERTARSQRADR